MIIPIRCFTCGKVIADKWKFYSEKVKQLEEEAANKKNKTKEGEDEEAKEPKFRNFQPGFKKEILDELGLDKMCCRRQIMCHIDLIDVI